MELKPLTYLNTYPMMYNSWNYHQYPLTYNYQYQTPYVYNYAAPAVTYKAVEPKIQVRDLCTNLPFISHKSVLSILQ